MRFFCFIALLFCFYQLEAQSESAQLGCNKLKAQDVKIKSQCCDHATSSEKICQHGPLFFPSILGLHFALPATLLDPQSSDCIDSGIKFFPTGLSPPLS